MIRHYCPASSYYNAADCYQICYQTVCACQCGTSNWQLKLLSWTVTHNGDVGEDYVLVAHYTVQSFSYTSLLLLANKHFSFKHRYWFLFYIWKSEFYRNNAGLDDSSRLLMFHSVSVFSALAQTVVSTSPPRLNVCLVCVCLNLWRVGCHVLTLVMSPITCKMCFHRWSQL